MTTPSVQTHFILDKAEIVQQGKKGYYVSMFFTSQTSRHLKFLFSILLTLLLMCSLETKLHVHHFAHSHDNHLEQYHGSGVAGHHHHGKIHFSHDRSHHEHYGDFILEFDVIPDGLLKNIIQHPLALVLFVFSILLLAPSARLLQRHHEKRPILDKYYLLSPPLRAPPQHL